MNPKIAKLRGELDKNTSKIAALQAKNRELERQIRELENTDIIGLVRETGMSAEEFAALFQQLRGASSAPVQGEDADEA